LQAKRYEVAQDSFIKYLIAIAKTPAETIDEFDAKRLNIQLRTIDLSDPSSHYSIDKLVLK
jgi:hypothetical protein